jgi:hypothetical protein
MIIALCGLKTSGKTALAKLLSGEGKSAIKRPVYYKRKSFAKPLYLMMEALLVYQGASKKEINHLFHEGKEEPTPYLDGKSIRHGLQTLGEEWGRQHIDRGIWVNSLLRSSTRYPNTIIDDMRYLNEANAVRDIDGFLFRIERPGVVLDPRHISELEQLRIEVDFTIVNDGEPDDMVRQLDNFLKGKS